MRRRTHFVAFGGETVANPIKDFKVRDFFLLERISFYLSLLIRKNNVICRGRVGKNFNML